MEPKERRYFEKMSKYSLGITTASSLNSAVYLAYFKSMINSAAKDALAEEISPNNAKKNITYWLESIKELKKGEK